MPDPTGRVSHLPDMHRGVAWKEPCRVATTANVTISTALNAGDTIDGVTLAAGDRVLVKNQSTGSQNGIYVAGATPVRAFDMDQYVASSVPAEEIAGAFVYVVSGTTNGGKLFYTTNALGGTLGSTTITFAEFASGADISALTAAVFGYLAHGSTGSTETFDASAAGWHSATLNANCTFTFTGATSGQVASMVLELKQDSTGSRLVTWPGSVAWPGGTAPTLSTAANATDILLFESRDGGTTWFGFLAGSGGGATALDDLTDVTISSPAAADRLRYDGTSQWRNSALIWTPLTVFNGTDWLPLVDGSGNAIMAEA